MSRNIGLSVSAPKSECTDSHCPFHGNLPVRGKLFEGTVVSAKARKMVVVQRETPKYLDNFKYSNLPLLEGFFNLVLSANGPLYDEPLNALKFELKNPERFVAILRAISEGKVESKEIADFIGDSLGLSLQVKNSNAKRVDFQSVFFMGATAKIING
ncbi:MAG: quinolinate synthase NadA, partial [Thermoproteota archaeon]